MVEIREKPAWSWLCWRSRTGTLHPCVNTTSIMPAELLAPRPTRSHQLSKFCLFNFTLPSGRHLSDSPQTLSAGRRLIPQAHPPVGSTRISRGRSRAARPAPSVLPGLIQVRGKLLARESCLGHGCRSSSLTSLQTPLAKLVFSKDTYHLNHLSIP